MGITALGLPPERTEAHPRHDLRTWVPLCERRGCPAATVREVSAAKCGTAQPRFLGALNPMSTCNQSASGDLRAEARIPEGRRNNSLFRFALQQVRHCDSYDALLDVMRTRNMDCEPPLAEDVIISTARSAWRYEQEGRNLIGRGRSVLMPHSLVDELI